MKQGKLVSFLIALQMGAVRALLITYTNLGFQEGFVWECIKAWAVSVVMSYPLLLVVTPVSTFIVEKMEPLGKYVRRNLINAFRLPPC